MQAREFHEVRLKSYEKKLYKELNGSPGIKFPIKVDLALHAHKRSLIVQAELGGVEFPLNEQYTKYKRQFNQEKTLLFSHVHRLVHCIIDCQIYKQDAVAARHALELARSLSARAWDSSPYEMKQLPQVGLVAIRKLAIGGINSIESLEAAETHRVEMILSKNPPFGQKLLENLRAFPKLRVSLKMMGKEINKGRSIMVKFKIECGFMNEKFPQTFLKKPVYVCLLIERSDGYLIDFKRIGAKNLSNDRAFFMSAEVNSHMQYISCYIMCDRIAGTLRYAELNPGFPPSLFPPISIPSQQMVTRQENLDHSQSGPSKETSQTSPSTLKNDEFGEDELGDQDMVDAVTGMEFRHIDEAIPNSDQHGSKSSSLGHKESTGERTKWNPEKLENGKWACNHKCKDKTACKHMCCRDGLDKTPKPPKNAFVPAVSQRDASSFTDLQATSADPPPAERVVSAKNSAKEETKKIETLDLVRESDLRRTAKNQPTGLRNLQRLHGKVVREPAISQMVKGRPPNDRIQKRQLETPSANSPPSLVMEASDLQSNHNGDLAGSLPSPTTLLNKNDKVNERALCDSSEVGNGCLSSPPPVALRNTRTS